MNQSNNLPNTSQISEIVFRTDTVNKIRNYGPVFFVPKQKINSPFEDMFIPANVGQDHPNQSKFIPANTDISNEPNVYRARSVRSRVSSIGYLIANIM